jgi:glutamate dehydrogenase (NAD(P)+)
MHVHEPGLGLRGTLVVDNVATGPAIGGLRMAADVEHGGVLPPGPRHDAQERRRRAAPRRGQVRPRRPAHARERKEQLVRAFACALRSADDYIFGPDMGTDETCMAWVKAEIGRAVGLPMELGGIPLDEIGATGFGLSTPPRSRCPAPIPLAGARVVVQGFGAVGLHAARFLAERGARVVARRTPAARPRPGGLDVAALVAEKRSGRSVAEHGRGRRIEGDALVDVECEVWIPAARPDVLRADNAGRLRARAVIAGANIPATEEAERMLHERGVLVVPDFIANAGGVICAAMEYHGATRGAAFAAIEERIRANVEAVLADAEKRGVAPRRAAVDLAVGRVRRAMAWRRWSIF